MRGKINRPGNGLAVFKPLISSAVRRNKQHRIRAFASLETVRSHDGRRDGRGQDLDGIRRKNIGNRLPDGQNDAKTAGHEGVAAQIIERNDAAIVVRTFEAGVFVADVEFVVAPK